MCTTSVVLVFAALLCYQTSHTLYVTSFPEKNIDTHGDISTPHGLYAGESTTKHSILQKTVGAAKESKNDNTVQGTRGTHQHHYPSNVNNWPRVDNSKQYAINDLNVRGNIHSPLSFVNSTLSRDIKNYAKYQTIISNFSSKHKAKNAPSGHMNHENRLSSTAGYYSRKALPVGTGQVSGKGVRLLASVHKVDHNSLSNQKTRLKKDHQQSTMVSMFGEKKKRTRQRIKGRKSIKLRKKISLNKWLISGSKQLTMNRNNVLRPKDNALDTVHLAKKKHRHHHHHHRHHRRHRHHHYEQGVSNKKKQQGSSKPEGGYRLAPPMMVTPKPTPTKKQTKIFKVQKKVLYSTEHNQEPAEKRFVILGGPQGIHHLNRFHFSPALVNALKLVLNKRNSFKKDADILNLAKALETKDTDGSIPKNSSITTSVFSGKTQNGQRARLVTVKDPGYVKPKSQNEMNSNLHVHHDKGPVNTKAENNGLRRHKMLQPNNAPVLVQSLNASQMNRPQKITGYAISKEPSNQVLGQAAYRSEISEDHAHSTLVDPTSLGISILKLLFGKRAKLVVKPKFKMLVNGRPDKKYLQGYGTPKQRAELQKEIEEENKLMLLKGSNKEVFEATLAKSISNLITALNKNEKTSTSTKIQPDVSQNISKSSSQISAHIQESKSKQNTTTQEQGMRKSWVLLKMPKTGEKEDDNVEKYQDNEDELRQNAIKLIATVGKHNNMVSDVKVAKNNRLLDDDGIIDSVKKPKENEDDTSAKEVSPISYNLSGIKSKNELTKTPSADASAVETTLSKILKGIQDSIKELKEQRKDSHSNNKIKVTSYPPSHTALKSSDTSPSSFTSSGLTQASAVAKIPDLLAAVNSLLGAESHKAPLGVAGVPSDETAAVKNPAISIPTTDADPSEAARRYVSDVRASNDPLLPRPDIYDEPITSVGHSRSTHDSQGPSDNVLFESDEMAAQRDTQNTLEAMKLKEGIVFVISPLPCTYLYHLYRRTTSDLLETM